MIREELKRAYFRTLDRISHASHRDVVSEFSNFNSSIISTQLSTEVQNAQLQLEKDLYTISKQIKQNGATLDLMDAMHMNLSVQFQNFLGEFRQTVAFYKTQVAPDMPAKDFSELLEKCSKQVEKLVWHYFSARLLALIRWFVFVVMIELYEETNKDFEIVYVPLTKGDFHTDVCKLRKKLFKKQQFSVILDLFRRNATEFQGEKIVTDSRGTFLNPHYGCDSLFLPKGV
ncbi:MAG: hypothetical protein ACP5KD_08910 [Fervidobacterium sp.]